MFKSTFLCLASMCWLSSAALAQGASETVKRQTASALRTALPTVATRDDVDALARLGDFEGAARVAGRAKDRASKAALLVIVAKYVAQNALRQGQLEVAETNIRAMKDDLNSLILWLELSRAYSQKQRPLDARRTALYASAQVQRQNDTYWWPDVALRLCELGDRATARRLFVVAQKELLDPDPLFGSPKDTVIEAAARCGFDDIAFDTQGSWPFSAVVIWSQQNRDKVARRFMEQQAKRIAESFAKEVPAGSQPVEHITTEQVARSTRLFGLLILAQGQVARGDIMTALGTWQELDALLKDAQGEPNWFEYKLFSLEAFESLGQWDLADATLAELNAHLKELKATRQAQPALPQPPKGSRPKGFSPQNLEGRLAEAQLDGLKVVFNSKRFSEVQRRAALARVQPRLLRFAQAYPQNRSRYFSQLAQAQRSLGEKQWRANLLRSQEQTVADAKRTGQWVLLSLVARDWREAGDDAQARSLGRQMLSLWRKSSRTPNREVLATSLADCGLYEEATQVLIPRRDMSNYMWRATLSQVAQKWNAAPPSLVLTLAPMARHEALLGWATGLVPDKDYQRRGTGAQALQDMMF